MASNDQDFERGTFIVSHGGRTTDVVADRWDYGENGGGFDGGNLRLWDGDKIVAEFKWWDSVLRKSDD